MDKINVNLKNLLFHNMGYCSIMPGNVHTALSHTQKAFFLNINCIVIQFQMLIYKHRSLEKTQLSRNVYEFVELVIV